MDRAVASVTFGDVALAELRVSHVEHWAKTMVDRGLAPSTINTHFVNVRSVIKAAVKRIDADLLLLGTHAYAGMSRAFLGTVAGDVLRNVSCDVLVVPPRHARARAQRA